jgi:hypothetical protein
MQKPHDDSKACLTAFVQDSTLTVVIEMSLASWLVAGMIPGVKREPRKKIGPNPEVLLQLLYRWRYSPRILGLPSLCAHVGASPRFFPGNPVFRAAACHLCVMTRQKHTAGPRHRDAPQSRWLTRRRVLPLGGCSLGAQLVNRNPRVPRRP